MKTTQNPIWANWYHRRIKGGRSKWTLGLGYASPLSIVGTREACRVIVSCPSLTKTSDLMPIHDAKLLAQEWALAEYTDAFGKPFRIN
jgi:exo-beta-1,3-glucanase (GH17 family)